MAPKGDGFENDPFWNIDTLMPKGAKKLRSPGREKHPLPSEKRTAPAGAEASGIPGGETPFIRGFAGTPSGIPGEQGRLSAFSDTPERSYRQDSGVIREVSIYAWPNKYAFFSNFRKNAEMVLGLSASEAPFVPFFSFMPQYHQLNASQLRYYLYWRASFISGQPLKADFCYLMLFICEIINLPDVIAPQKGADLLAEIWLTYRRSYSKLDKYLSEWLCDYCLIHNVLPREKLFAALCPVGRASGSFKEFYLTKEEQAHPGLSLSTYAYKTGKYRNDQNAELFDRHIPAAMDAFFALLRRREGEGNGPAVELRLTRSSYDGAVCIYSEKKRIDVVYVPVRTVGTPPLVTEAEKLCENYVRAALGIRARFPTALPDPGMREAIEGYFAVNLPSSMTRKANEEYRYDDRYEPVSHGFSAEEAEKIERDSRGVAIRLGAVYEADPLFEDAGTEERASGEARAPAAGGGLNGQSVGQIDQSDSQSGQNGSGQKDGQKAEPPAPQDYQKEYKEALSALKTGGSAAFAAYAEGLGLLPHTLADEINEEALARIGDIVLVGDDSGIELLPDYLQEVDEWINN